MKPIKVTVNEKQNGFHIPSDFTRARLHEWMKQYRWFRIEPIESESINRRRYLEAAIIPEYCLYQYGINPRDPAKDEARRLLFKRDFNYEIVEKRDGTPERIPVSSKGKAREMVDKFVEWAEQNGCKIPNPELYKLWRDKWSMDMRFDTFHDFLAFLKLDCDAMPSNETLETLNENHENMRTV